MRTRTDAWQRPTNCADCRRPLAARRWGRLPDGRVEHMARGLCRACYTAHKRAGDLPAFAPVRSA